MRLGCRGINSRAAGLYWNDCATHRKIKEFKFHEISHCNGRDSSRLRGGQPACSNSSVATNQQAGDANRTEAIRIHRNAHGGEFSYRHVRTRRKNGSASGHDASRRSSPALTSMRWSSTKTRRQAPRSICRSASPALRRLRRPDGFRRPRAKPSGSCSSLRALPARRKWWCTRSPV